MWLRPVGLPLRGEDSLAALSEAARQRLRKALRGAGEATGIGFDIRFHLYPDLKLRRAGGRAILTLPDGAIWILEHDDSCEMRIEDSVWLDNAAAIPRPARQIVLTGLMDAQVVQIGWTLARSEVS